MPCLKCSALMRPTVEGFEENKGCIDCIAVTHCLNYDLPDLSDYFDYSNFY